MNPRAFLCFKNNSDISRTLVQNNFKPKLKSGIEKRMEDVISVFNMTKKNTKELNRLQDELE